jgi:hypothetical protein
MSLCGFYVPSKKLKKACNLFVYLKFPSYQFLHYLKQFCSSNMSTSYSHQLLKLVCKQISYRLSSHSTAQNLLLKFPPTVLQLDTLLLLLSLHDEHN